MVATSLHEEQPAGLSLAFGRAKQDPGLGTYGSCPVQWRPGEERRRGVVWSKEVEWPRQWLGMLTRQSKAGEAASLVESTLRTLHDTFRHIEEGDLVSDEDYPSDEESDEIELGLELREKSDSRMDHQTSRERIRVADFVEAPGTMIQVGSTDRVSWDFCWPRGLVLLIALIYGTNFVSVKWINNVMPPSLAAAIRFFIAALALAPAVWMARQRKTVWADGFITGVAKALGYFFQAMALGLSAANKVAFLCSLAVIFVPFTEHFLLRRHHEAAKGQSSLSWGSAVVAVIGVGLLELGGKTGFSLGDCFGLLQALFFGFGYISNERAIRRNPHDALAVSGVQLGVIALAGLAWAGTDVLREKEVAIVFSSYAALSAAILVLLYTRLVTTASTVVFESVALNHVSASEFSILLSSEPLWASMFSQALLGETLGACGYLGGALIIMACVSSALKEAKLKRSTRPSP